MKIQELALCSSFWVLVLHLAMGFLAPPGMLTATPRSALRRCNSQWTRPVTSAEGDGEVDSAGLNEDIAKLDEDIGTVQQDIKAVEHKIERIEVAMDKGLTYMGISDPMLLREEKNRLYDAMNLLREEKKQLREEKKQLRTLTIAERQKLTVPVYFTEDKDEELVAFHNSLTNATVTDDLLQLPDGVSFLGNEKLGNKLFIRQCYRDLQKIIFDGAKIGTLDKIVVTGTPGIGKSVFNFYLLYLLRLQGKTVLFNLKDIWYRFTDEGVESSRTDFPFKYYRDKNGWFLCDPEKEPTGSFRGITVVTVSPEEERMKEFLKMANSIRLFMSPWSLEELKMCRRLQYPEVSEKEVEAAFDMIGGVARYIFNRDKLEGYLEDMSFKADIISDEELRLIKTFGMSIPEKISDKLVHIFPLPRSRCTEYRLDYASKKAEDLITWIQSMKDVDELIGEVLDAKRSGVTGSELGHCFERVADAFLQFPVYEPEEKAKPFHFPRVVRGGGGEIDTVQFRFKIQSRVWGMDYFPFTLKNSVYYKPVDPNFPDIDAFGVIDGVLYLFQMKISKAGIKASPVFKDKLWTSLKNVAGKEKGIDKWVFVYVVPSYPGGIKVLNHEAHFENVVEKWRKETSSGLKSVFDDVWTIGVTLEKGKIDL